MGIYALQIDDKTRTWWAERLEGLSIEDQIEKLIVMHEMAAAQRDRAERQKAAPERQEFDELRGKYEQAIRRLQSTEADRDSWKRIAERFGEENHQLKTNTRIPWLEREVENWKDRWTHVQQRMQELAEHHFNGALHEENLNAIEQSNRSLRSLNTWIVQHLSGETIDHLIGSAKKEKLANFAQLIEEARPKEIRL